MSSNKGKEWENRFKNSWLSTFDKDTVLIRLQDQVSGYKEVSKNPCDFLAFVKNKLFMVECKSHDGASIDFSALPQYERLLPYKEYEQIGCFPGFLIWFKNKDKVIWVPIQEAEKIHNAGEKSIGLRHLDKYKILDMPIEKKRVYVYPDYHSLLDFVDRKN